MFHVKQWIKFYLKYVYSEYIPFGFLPLVIKFFIKIFHKKQLVIATKKAKKSAEEPHYLGHRRRLRERFLDSPEALPDYELLELFLFWIYPRIDTKQMAKKLMEQHGSVSNIFFLEKADVCPETFYAGIKTVKEIARRIAMEQIRDAPLLNNTTRVLDYCKISMSGLKTEQFCIFYLDKKHFLIKEEMQEYGTVDQTALYPREVVKKSLALNATGVIIVHNHPSGDPSPSGADKEITKALAYILSSVNISLLDHLIVARYGYFSFRENSLL